jgi:hypothetical protein
MNVLEDKKLKYAESSLIEASYLYQHYNLPRCWMMVQKALAEYGKLSMKKEKLKYVEEQILIRYLGLGWEEAYHPWSKNKHL